MKQGNYKGNLVITMPALTGAIISEAVTTSFQFPAHLLSVFGPKKITSDHFANNPIIRPSSSQPVEANRWLQKTQQEWQQDHKHKDL